MPSYCSYNAISQKKKLFNFNLKRNTKRMLFYILLLVLPLLQFFVFYIIVNFNSIAMAFSSYSYKDDAFGYNQVFGFKQFADNMKVVFQLFKQKPYIITNSLRLFFYDTIIGLPLAIIFSYYLYKKRPFSKIFRVMLFMPQIISGVVFANIYIFMLEALSTWFGSGWNMLNPAAGVDTNRSALIFFSICMTFGVNVLLFSGSMGNINPSLCEAAELDGCNSIQEFLHVTIPSIFPTIISFIVVGLAGIFTNQMFLAHINNNNLPHTLDTVGYFLYYQAAGSDYIVKVGDNDKLNFPQLSCISLLITVILFPLTFGIKKLLEKYGPSTR